MFPILNAQKLKPLKGATSDILVIFFERSSLAVFRMHSRTLAMPHLLTFARAILFVLLISVMGTTLSAPQVALSARQIDEPLTLYLPVHTAEHPDLVEGLKQEYSAANLGELRIQTADYWNSYQWALRTGKPGLYFAAPHFFAWAIHKHNFAPLLRLSEPLKYVIASRTNSSEIFEVSDLNNRAVCSKRALNLDYLLLNTAFDNRLHSAEAVTVMSVAKAMTEPSHQCLGFSISDHHFVEQELREPGKFIRLQQGKTFSNFGFMLHPTGNAAYQKQLTEFLLSDTVQALLRPIFLQTSSKAILIEAKASDYPKHYLAKLKPYWRDSTTNK